MEKWTRGIWRKRRRGCSISGVQWWIDSGLEKPHLAGCFQKHSFTHVQWCYAFQTSSVFLLSKDAAYCKCSQNVCQQRKKRHSSVVRVRLGCGVCGMCILCLDLFCKAVKNIRVYLHKYYLCVGYFTITLCSVRLTLSPAMNELGFAIAKIVISYPFWTLFCIPNIRFLDPENIIWLDIYFPFFQFYPLALFYIISNADWWGSEK